MGKLSQEQEEILAQIDAMISMLERYNMDMGSFDSLTISLSPMQLLLSLLRRCGVTQEEIIDFLSNFIVVVTPVLEIALKGLLIAKLKGDIDCNLDPRIPAQYREKIEGITRSPLYQSGNDTGDESYQERGIEIDLTTIDYYGMLNESPMSDNSHYKYFGTKKYYNILEDPKNSIFYNYTDAIAYCKKNGIDTKLINRKSEIDSVYELVRARDMNAFLWFILHKAKFLNAQDIANETNSINGSKCILKTINGTVNAGDKTIVSLGTPFIQTDGADSYSVMGLCIKYQGNQSLIGSTKEQATPNQTYSSVSDIDVANSIMNNMMNISNYTYKIVPTTNIWNGANWYVNRSEYYNFLSKKKERDYEKEFALFRLFMKTIDGKNTNKLVFQIKPAPNFITPEPLISYKFEQIENDKKKLKITYNGDMPWNFHTLLFDENGVQQNNGKYSVVVKGLNRSIINNKYTIYDLIHPSSKQDITNVQLYVNKLTREYKLVGTNQDVRTALYECYPGMTIYEFNYDFIMGMQLFDPTVLTAQLIEGLTNIRYGGTFNKVQSNYQMRISEIVKKILDTNGYESTDCFFSFSNAEYDKMERESELKRASLYPFNNTEYGAQQMSNIDAYGILNEYNVNASLEENISVVSRTITQASAIITNEVMPEDKYTVQYDFITKSIEMLTSIFVEALLSPKMLMILFINQRMMGDIENPKNWTLEYVLNAFTNVIYGLVEQVRDMILQKLLELNLNKYKLLLEGVKKILAFEQLEYYTRLMRLMLEACKFTHSKNPNLASTLDVVDYADIIPNDIPLTNEC